MRAKKKGKQTHRVRKKKVGVASSARKRSTQPVGGRGDNTPGGKKKKKGSLSLMKESGQQPQMRRRHQAVEKKCPTSEEKEDAADANLSQSEDFAEFWRRGKKLIPTRKNGVNAFPGKKEQVLSLRQQEKGHPLTKGREKGRRFLEARGQMVSKGGLIFREREK